MPPKRVVGPCVECGAPGSTRRLYKAFVCDEHYKTDQYRLITKGKAMNEFGLASDAIELLAKGDKPKIHMFRRPNPHGKDKPPMKLIRYYDMIALFPNK